MAYSKFSTEDADYYLAYGNHLYKQNEEIFQKENIRNLDAIVLEHSALDPISHGLSFFQIHPQYADIFKNTEDSYKGTGKSIPLYFVDVLNKYDAFSFAFGRGFIGCMALGMLTHSPTAALAGFSLGFTDVLGLFLAPGKSKSGKIRKGIAHITSAFGYLPPAQIIALRNAIAAKKTSEFIIPHLKKEFGKKPNIAIVYGANHSGIETDLKYPFLRDSVLGIYKTLGYWGIEKDRLEKVVEAKYLSQKQIQEEMEKKEATKIKKLQDFSREIGGKDPYGWLLKEYETNLFSVGENGK